MLAGFEQVESRGFYRPAATLSFDAAVESIAQGIRHARALGLTDMIANTCGLTGFAPPNTLGRYAMAVKWAETAGGGPDSVRVALIARPELIDQDKIGVVIAQNRGMLGDVFTNETEAITWLDARRAATL